jgi:hypothetical protein
MTEMGTNLMNQHRTLGHQLLLLVTENGSTVELLAQRTQVTASIATIP